MANRSRGRHNYKFTGKKHSVPAAVALVLAVVPLCLFFYAEAVSFRRGGNAPEIIGGVGVSALLIAVLSLMISLKEVKKEEVFKGVPVFASVFAFLMLAGWLVIYGMGFLYS